jgi:hypothetical protein
MRQDLFQAVRRPDGTRDEVRVATDVCFCCKTAVAAGPDGALYLAWRHIFPPNIRDIAVARSSDGGRSFNAPVRVSDDGWAIDGCPDDGPALAAGPAGVLHVVWPTQVGSAKGVFYSFSLDGGRTFAPRVRLDEAGFGAAHPQIAAREGGVTVAWDEGGAASRRVAVRDVVDGGGGRWSPRLGPMTVVSGGGAAVYPAAEATPAGAVVAWTEQTASGSEIAVRRLAR